MGLTTNDYYFCYQEISEEEKENYEVQIPYNEIKLIEKNMGREVKEHLKEIKKRIKNIKNRKEFEIVIKELEAEDIVDAEYFEKLKKKKKKKLNKKNFNEQLKCDNETLTRIADTIKRFKMQEKNKEIKEQVLNRDEREREGGAKDKEREKGKSREEKTRASGGRTRGDR